MMAACLPPSSPAHPANGARKLIQRSGTEHHSQEGDGAPRCHARRRGDVGATVLGHWEGMAGSSQASPACCCSCLRGGCRNDRTGSQAETAALSPHGARSPSPHCASFERRGLRFPSSGGTPWINVPPQSDWQIDFGINQSINQSRAGLWGLPGCTPSAPSPIECSNTSETGVICVMRSGRSLHPSQHLSREGWSSRQPSLLPQHPGEGARGDAGAPGHAGPPGE